MSGLWLLLVVLACVLAGVATWLALTLATERHRCGGGLGHCVDDAGVCVWCHHAVRTPSR